MAIESCIYGYAMHTGSPFDTSSFTFCLWVGISVGDTERGQRALRCLFGLLCISSLHPCACFTTIQFQESEAILSCGQVAPLTTQKPHKHRIECFKHIAREDNDYLRVEHITVQ